MTSTGNQNPGRHQVTTSPASQPDTSPKKSSMLPLTLAVSAALCAVVGVLVWAHYATLSQQQSTTASAAAPASAPSPEPTFDTKVAEGEYLFQNRGCFACHGQQGRGGVVNTNYVADTVPALNQLADRLMLWEPEDAQTAVTMIEEGRDPHAVTDPPFRTWGRFVAQYDAVLAVITNGSPAAKKDPDGPTPPLQMPSWRDRLTPDQMKSIMAYLITQFPWDEDEDTASTTPDASTVPPPT